MWYWYNCVNYEPACLHTEFTSWPSQAEVLICGLWKLFHPLQKVLPIWGHADPRSAFSRFCCLGGGQSRQPMPGRGLLPKSAADSKVASRLGAGRQKSKCHPLAAERAEDLSPASDRCQGTVDCFLILVGRLAGILPRQTSVVSSWADLLPRVLFQVARLGASLAFGSWCAGGRERGNPYPFLRRLVKLLSLLQDSKTHTLYELSEKKRL